MLTMPKLARLEGHATGSRAPRTNQLPDAAPEVSQKVENTRGLSTRIEYTRIEYTRIGTRG